MYDNIFAYHIYTKQNIITNNLNCHYYFHLEIYKTFFFLGHKKYYQNMESPIIMIQSNTSHLLQN